MGYFSFVDGGSLKKSGTFVLCAILSASACGTREPPISSVECRVVSGAEPALIGQRVILEGPADSFIYVFDADRLPKIRLRRDAIKNPEQLRLVWSNASASSSVAIELSDVPKERLLLRARHGPLFPPGDAELALFEGTGSCPPIFVQAVRWTQRPDQLLLVQRAARLRASGDLPTLERLLAETSTASAEEKAWAALELARAINARDPARGIDAWIAAAGTARAAGLLSEVGRRLRAAAHTAWRSRKFAQGMALIADAETIDRRTGDHWGRLRADLVRGLLEFEGGFYRSAETSLRRGLEEARSFGLREERADLEGALANLLQSVGSYQAAIELLDAAEPTTTPEQRAFRLNNRGVIQTTAMIAGAIPAEYEIPRRAFAEAVEIWGRLDRRSDEANELANLAWVEFLAGRTDSAGNLVQRARDRDPSSSAYHASFLDILQAEIYLAQKNYPAADRIYVSVLKYEAAGDSAAQAHYGLARSLLARGKIAAARKEMNVALALGDALVRDTLLHPERVRSFAGEGSIFEDAIALALAAGDVAEAFELAERARARVLTALEGSLRLERMADADRQTWRHLVDTFRAARDRVEELETAERFAARQKRAAIRETLASKREAAAKAFEAAQLFLSSVSPLGISSSRASDISNALGDTEILWTPAPGTSSAFLAKKSGIELIAPEVNLAQKLDGATHLYIVGGLAAFPGGLEQLYEKMTITSIPYAGLLLAPIETGGTHALVIGDPGGDLPNARQLGAELARRLPKSVSLQQNEATRERVLRELGALSIFVFAGHGVFRDRQPWSTSLQLHREQDLTVADVFMVRPRIRLAVLAACQSGRAARVGAFEGIGFPEAFLLSGTRAVVGTNRIVGDREAFIFVRRFLDEDGLNKPAEALRRTFLALRSTDAETAKAFEIFGRPD